MSMYLSNYLFYISLSLLTMIGGTLFLLGIPFRPVLLVPLFIFGIFTQRNNINKINKKAIIISVLFIIHALISFITNSSSFYNVLLFMRNLIIPLSVSLFINTTYTPLNSSGLITLLTTIACIQLPIILLQRLFYKQILSSSGTFIPENDIGFGTFYVSCDPTMTFFLIGMFLILQERRDRNIFSIIQFILIILAIISSKSVASRYSFLLFMPFILFRKGFRLKYQTCAFIFLFLSLNILMITLIPTVQMKARLMLKTIIHFLPENIEDYTTNTNFEKFITGDYTRNTAVMYYLQQPISFFGDGPGKNVNPINLSFGIGVHGHILTFYSELGIIGLLLSYFLIYSLLPEKKIY